MNEARKPPVAVITYAVFYWPYTDTLVYVVVLGKHGLNTCSLHHEMSQSALKFLCRLGLQCTVIRGP
jgi:hypothetical protein